jgi:hypothetical protein
MIDTWTIAQLRAEEARLVAGLAIALRKAEKAHQAYENALVYWQSVRAPAGTFPDLFATWECWTSIQHRYVRDLDAVRAELASRCLDAYRTAPSTWEWTAEDAVHYDGALWDAPPIP